MRIAQVALLYESVPSKYYGGTEPVVWYQTEELFREEDRASADGENSIDLSITRYETGVGVNILRRDGCVNVIVTK